MLRDEWFLSTAFRHALSFLTSASSDLGILVVFGMLIRQWDGKKRVPMALQCHMPRESGTGELDKPVTAMVVSVACFVRPSTREDDRSEEFLDCYASLLGDLLELTVDMVV